MVDNLSSGVWGVVATPFLGSALEVDETSLSRLVKHYEGIGVTGLTVLGVFGEAARLSAQERRTVLEVVAASVELPLVVGVTGLATAPVIEEARLVREVVGDRLAGLMVQVNSPDPRVVAAHLNAVHDATGSRHRGPGLPGGQQGRHPYGRPGPRRTGSPFGGRREGRGTADTGRRRGPDRPARRARLRRPRRAGSAGRACGRVHAAR